MGRVGRVSRDMRGRGSRGAATIAGLELRIQWDGQRDVQISITRPQLTTRC